MTTTEIAQDGTEVSVFQFRMLIHYYIFEITTGIRACRIPLSRVARNFGVNTTNKKKALAQLLANYEASVGEPYKDERLEKIFG